MSASSACCWFLLAVVSLFSRTSLAFNQFCLLQHNIFNMIATSQHGSSRPLIERLQSSVIIFITPLYSGLDRLTASPSILRSVFHLYYLHIGHLFTKRVFIKSPSLYHTRPSPFNLRANILVSAPFISTQLYIQLKSHLYARERERVSYRLLFYRL